MGCFFSRNTVLNLHIVLVYKKILLIFFVSVIFLIPVLFPTQLFLHLPLPSSPSPLPLTPFHLLHRYPPSIPLTLSNLSLPTPPFPLFLLLLFLPILSYFHSSYSFSPFPPFPHPFPSLTSPPDPPFHLPGLCYQAHSLKTLSPQTLLLLSLKNHQLKSL